MRKQIALQIMRLNWNINARVRSRSTKVEEGNAALWVSPGLDILDLIIRTNLWQYGTFKI